MENRPVQPKALYLLFFVQMWECFSYYGMRVLLVLYMVQVLGFSDGKALAIFALYCALVEFGGLFGGHLADRLIGQKQAIFLGGWLIALGHINMMFGDGEGFLYVSLSLISVGTGLFSSNVSSLLGQFYEENDPRREEGFTYFYVGINLGAVLSTICCGMAAEIYGWHAGFGAAAFGMLLGNGALFFFNNTLEGKGKAIRPLEMKLKFMLLMGILGAVAVCTSFIYMQQWMMPIIPLICLGCVGYAGHTIYRSGCLPLRKILILGGCLSIFALFYSGVEQIGGSLLLFSEKYGSRSLFGISIPSSALVGLNPLTVILLGVPLSKIAEKWQMSNHIRLATGCLFGSLAFGLFTFSTSLGEVPVLILMMGIILISLGELLVGPVMYAYFSESVPHKHQGIAMGLIPIGYSFASILSGVMSQAMTGESESPKILYAQGFGKLSLLLLACGLLIYLGNYFYKRSLRKENYGIS